MIHKTKKEEGKKHITMPLRWEFRLFWLDSRSIFACFGRFDSFWPFRSLADMAQFWPNQLGSEQIEADSARIQEKKKKKSLDAAPTRGQLCRTPCPALGCVELGCGICPVASVLSRYNLSFNNVVTFRASLRVQNNSQLL